MASSNIESRHIVNEEDSIVDMRPLTERWAEQLSKPVTYLLWAIPVLALSVLFPALGLLFVLAWLVLTVVFATNHYVLPVRYPVGSKDDKGKKGTGICLVGWQDSKSEFENFKEIWLSDDDMRKHILILGSTGSGKSEALKAIFFNALSWSSGFFIADGKADNKLPTDVYNMCRANGRDQDLLILNFLLAGKTPEEVRLSRRRRTNKLNPFPGADADTAIQMGANLLPKVEGDAKNWQEKALSFWRAVVTAIYYKRDKEGMEISVSTFLDYMALPMVEELYVEGFREAQERGGNWSYGYVGIKNYLDSGCPAYRVEKLLKKHKLKGDENTTRPNVQMSTAGKEKEFEQDNQAFEQHAYRTNQLMPVLNLLDKTYGFIFQGKYPEIDMSDVALRNRIFVMLIPSLEKSSSEAENLGKLAIACLRTMMGKNLGSEVEGSKRSLLDTKATNSPYPYVVALDELAYYFSDGIAVMFAQARSLGMSLIAAAQDIEKLTEGSRASEAGAMLANTTLKFFMRIDDAGKTAELIQKIIGKVRVGLRRSYKVGMAGSYKRESEVDIDYVDLLPTRRMQAFKQGEGVINALGRTTFMKWFYMGDDIKENHTDYFWVNRFLQVPPPSHEDLLEYSVDPKTIIDPYKQGIDLVDKLSGKKSVELHIDPNEVVAALAQASKSIPEGVSAAERGVLLYMAARAAILKGQTTVGPQSGQQASETASGAQYGVVSSATNQDLSKDVDPNSIGSTGKEDLSFLDDMLSLQRKPVSEIISAPEAISALGLRQQPVVAETQAPPRTPQSNQLAMQQLGFGVFAMAGMFNNQVGFAPSKNVVSPKDTEAGKLILGNSEVMERLEKNQIHAAQAQMNLEKAIELAKTPEYWQETGNALEHLNQVQKDGQEHPWITEGMYSFLETTDFSSSIMTKFSSEDDEVEQTVVGLSKDTLEGVTRLETLMNHPLPEKAARAFELSISRQVTPDMDSTLSPEQDEDTEELFRTWGI